LSSIRHFSDHVLTGWPVSSEVAVVSPREDHVAAREAAAISQIGRKRHAMPICTRFGTGKLSAFSHTILNLT
jgi:hypothetical protein